MHHIVCNTYNSFPTNFIFGFLRPACSTPNGYQLFEALMFIDKYIQVSEYFRGSGWGQVQGWVFGGFEGWERCEDWKKTYKARL